MIVYFDFDSSIDFYAGYALERCTLVANQDRDTILEFDAPNAIGADSLWIALNPNNEIIAVNDDLILLSVSLIKSDLIDECLTITAVMRYGNSH